MRFPDIVLGLDCSLVCALQGGVSLKPSPTLIPPPPTPPLVNAALDLLRQRTYQFPASIRLHIGRESPTSRSASQHFVSVGSLQLNFIRTYGVLCEMYLRNSDVFAACSTSILSSCPLLLLSSGNLTEIPWILLVLQILLTPPLLHAVHA